MDWTGMGSKKIERVVYLSPAILIGFAINAQLLLDKLDPTVSVSLKQLYT